MKNTTHRAAINEQRSGKAAQAEEAFAVLMTEASRRGFYGTVSVTLNVQDGFIQHVRVANDRLLK